MKINFFSFICLTQSLKSLSRPSRCRRMIEISRYAIHTRAARSGKLINRFGFFFLEKRIDHWKKKKKPENDIALKDFDDNARSLASLKRGRLYNSMAPPWSRINLHVATRGWLHHRIRSQHASIIIGVRVWPCVKLVWARVFTCQSRITIDFPTTRLPHVPELTPWTVRFGLLRTQRHVQREKTRTHTHVRAKSRIRFETFTPRTTCLVCLGF